jgi:hypothetical protein
MYYNGGTETIGIFVIQDDRCHAQKGSIEAFWVGFLVKLHAWVLKGFHMLIVFHRKVLEYNLGGVHDGISDMKRTLRKVTKTPNVWTWWKYLCRSTKDD